MDKWKVKYQDLRALQGKRPFFNQEETVEATNRKEATKKVKDDVGYYGYYGNYKASKIKE